MRHLQVAPTLEEASEACRPRRASSRLSRPAGRSVDHRYQLRGGDLLRGVPRLDLRNVTGRELLAAGTCCYGPRTTLTLGWLTSRGHEFL